MSNKDMFYVFPVYYVEYAGHIHEVLPEKDLHLYGFNPAEALYSSKNADECWEWIYSHYPDDTIDPQYGFQK
ncbi:hypothetical protein [Nostoc sp. CCY0012]|uniref:hypothetical protein n=1 Tax=Nostoc sp. CCY0012 TaxID=1056123 RepID=UPI0039C5EE41